MTKVLKVFGDDYAVVSFEGSDWTAGGAWEHAHRARGKVEFEDGCYFRALEFGEIDPKFIKFIRDTQDYDQTKHTNFFIIDDGSKKFNKGEKIIILNPDKVEGYPLVFIGKILNVEFDSLEGFIYEILAEGDKEIWNESYLRKYDSTLSKKENLELVRRKEYECR